MALADSRREAHAQAAGGFHHVGFARVGVPGERRLGALRVALSRDDRTACALRLADGEPLGEHSKSVDASKVDQSVVAHQQRRLVSYEIGVKLRVEPFDPILQAARQQAQIGVAGRQADAARHGDAPTIAGAPPAQGRREVESQGARHQTASASAVLPLSAA